MKLIMLLLLPLLVLAGQNPNTTATLWIHGFDPDGHEMTGVFGEDMWEENMDLLTELTGLPRIIDPNGINYPNVVSATTYYGDTYPSYYTSTDIAELNAITSTWGGGAPRYAMIVAKYARYLVDRCGAEQINLFSASYGSFVTRWLIEKDYENLASDGLIARWLTAEGVLAGHWAASNDDMLGLWELFGTPSLDVDQMHYDWVEANVNIPRTEADNPLYSDILVGVFGSTFDENGDMTDAMMLTDEFQPNDGVVGLYDSVFSSMTPESQFMNRTPPTLYFHDTHYTLVENPAAWAQIINFLTGKKRITITMTTVQVTDIHEPDDWWWDWTPAEIVFDSTVYSNANNTQWGFDGAVSQIDFETGSAPVFDIHEEGATQTLNHVIFDGFVLDSETSMNIDFDAIELDMENRYSINEEIGWEDPLDPMSGGSITVPVTTSGSHAFSCSDWNCILTVEVFDYPFESLNNLSDVDELPSERNLVLHPNYPNPFNPGTTLEFSLKNAGDVKITIHDSYGRIVKTFARESYSSGINQIVWNGCDDVGSFVASGLYFVRVESSADVQTQKIALIK